MANIRTIDEIGSKWATVTPQRSGDFEAGVRSPKNDWAKGATDANAAWKEGVSKAVTGDRFVKGIAKAGTATWQDATLQKGVSRWGPGVQLAQGKYEANFAPYREAIARVQLPPRFAKRDPRNLERVKAIVDALVKVKLAS